MEKIIGGKRIYKNSYYAIIDGKSKIASHVLKTHIIYRSVNRKDTHNHLRQLLKKVILDIRKVGVDPKFSIKKYTTDNYFIIKCKDTEDYRYVNVKIVFVEHDINLENYLLLI